MRLVLFIMIFWSFWIFTIATLNHYDTRETLRINNERCSNVAALAGAHEWKTNYRGECYFAVNNKLEMIDVN